MRNLRIAAAVAVALGVHGTTEARVVAQAGPSVAACAAATVTLYVAGGSSGQAGFATALGTDLFGGTSNTTTIKGTNGNFQAYCGAAAAGNSAGIATGTIVTVYYRAEGGAVMASLPIVSGQPVKTLNLQTPACQVTNPVVNGTSSVVGSIDGWTGCLTTHQVELGISDIEPTQFVGANYPSSYSTTVFGSASPAQLAALPKTRLYSQAHGLFVNTSGLNGGGTGQTVNLSKAAIAGILEGNYTDWSNVPGPAVAPISTTAAPITLVNREAGSASRAAWTIYALNTNCSSYSAALSDPNPANDYYATADVLNVVSSTPGAITYASIDNAGKYANVSLAQVDGVTPSNLASASGQYDVWFESAAIKGNVTSPGGAGLVTWLTGGELSNIATAPHTAQIAAIPNIGTNGPGHTPLTSNTLNGATIYLNPYTRSGNSCNLPLGTN